MRFHPLRERVVSTEGTPARAYLLGRVAARALVRKLQETGREVEADGLYELNDDRIDAADVLAVAVGERASMLEHDGGLPRDESERKAWAEVRTELQQGRWEL